MTQPLIYAMPGNEALAAALARRLDADLGELVVRRFPDAETYVRLLTSPAGRRVAFVCTLDRPDEKSVGLYFAASLARELGAKTVGLVAPYLAYMRQDARFNEGEAITAVQYAAWLSRYLDWLVTVDPHLHRIPSLDRIYAIPSTVVQSAPAIAAWIGSHVAEPLVVGPDGESAQWAGCVAREVGCPVVTLEKVRHGDRDVEVSLPELGAWQGRTPVLIDDIISTARTMIAAIGRLRAAGATRPAVCLGVHALFADDALAALHAAGAGTVATCNTIVHPTNAIDLCEDIARSVAPLVRR